MTSIGEKILFLHVPKTGGVWAAAAMKAAGIELSYLGDHLQLRDLDPKLDPHNRRFRIAFVREPYSWYRAFWAHRHTRGDWREGLPDRIARVPFEEFIRRAIEETPGFLSRYYEQYTGAPDQEVEFVGRCERLVDDLVRALTMAGQKFDERVLRSFPPTNIGSYNLPLDCSAELRERLMGTEARAYNRFYPEYLASDTES